MQTLPLFLSVKNKRVVVIGGGDVALRKVDTLLKAGASVYVVSPEFCQAFIDNSNKQLTLMHSHYAPEQLNSAWLVIAATDNTDVNRQVHQDATHKGIFVNVVDDPDYCEFIFPAIIDRSPIVIGISSNGKAPVLARLWKERLETLVPKWTGKFASIAGEFRHKVKQQFSDFTDRRHFWERAFRGTPIAHAEQNKWQDVEQSLNEMLSKHHTESFVITIHYGNGDPDNLTLKALRLMQLADEVYFSDDVPDSILALTRKDAHQIQLNESQAVEISKGVAVILKASEYCYVEQDEFQPR
jgi:uroporphyrin-III C-methyltransferase/precorrin-2 dehydrogenase/sirohydrochlorin ferrochelatase